MPFEAAGNAFTPASCILSIASAAAAAERVAGALGDSFSRRSSVFGSPLAGEHAAAVVAMAAAAAAFTKLRREELTFKSTVLGNFSELSIVVELWGELAVGKLRLPLGRLCRKLDESFGGFTTVAVGVNLT